MRSGSGPERVPAHPGDLGRFLAGLEALRRTTQGSRRSPAKRVRWEEEEQRNERVFALLGGNEGYGACDDEKLDKDLGSPPQLSPGTSARTAPAGAFRRPTARSAGGSWAGDVRAVARVSAASKMGSKMAEKRNSAVVIPQSLRPQEKTRGQP